MIFRRLFLANQLVACLVAFSLIFTFGSAGLDKSFSRCIAKEYSPRVSTPEDDEPEEEEADEPYAELVNKQHRVTGQTRFRSVKNSEKVTNVEFTQKNGAAKLEAQCSTKMHVPPNTIGYISAKTIFGCLHEIKKYERLKRKMR